MSSVAISIYLDTRRKKDNNTYPVKLRVYYNNKTRFYTTGIDLSEVEFKGSYLSERPRGDRLKELKVKIRAIESNGNAIKEELKKFSFEKFEKKLRMPSGAALNVFYHYDQIVEKLKSEKRITTASSYNLSGKSIKNFLKANNKGIEYLSFEDITASFLIEYERWMLRTGRGKTTVGIYLRPLRAIFNNAIAEGELNQELYPFGKRKYQIPAGRNIKKALSNEELKSLFDFSTEDRYMSKARDFWFFSYVCNGMNFRDIAELKYKDIGSDTLIFIRNKTKNTSKSNIAPIVVPLTDYAKLIIEKYGNADKVQDSYVFPILKKSMEEEEKVKRVQAFTRFVNQHIKRLAEQIDINSEISTYWARHSFATRAIHKGASIELIQESLGHTSPSTTMNYLKGFDTNVKKQLADKLMEF